MQGYVVRELMRMPDLTVANPAGTFGRRIIIPERDNMAITLFAGKIIVSEGYEKSGQTIMLKEEVEVPDEVIEAAILVQDDDVDPTTKLQELLHEIVTM